MIPLHPVVTLPSPVGGRTIQTAGVAELEQLDAADALTTCRVFQSFNCVASLLLHRAELAYYVALYQDGALWRALRTADQDSAEAAFRYFEEQARHLSEAQMRRTHLEAENGQLARLIEEEETQVEKLRNEQERHAAQAQTVAQRHQQLRREIAQMEAQHVAAQAQLNRLRRQIHQLGLTGNERIPHLPVR
ncbi:DUF2968 domain-containing protein [Paraburkholderia sediminicola]|nr:DUF2968 domain-containing protein [Paraburkholderia sediminicola]